MLQGFLILLNKSVLVLNQNYEPMSVCSVRRALILIFRGKAHPVETADEVVRSVCENFPVPSVVRLQNRTSLGIACAFCSCCPA